MNKNIAFRLRAFLIHLLISAIVAILSLILIYFIWFPSPLDKAVGVSNIFFMVLAIDSILGPILTLLVAKYDKESWKLRLDFTIIAVVQITALIYGMYNIAISRPVYIAFDRIRFELVQANNIPQSELAQAKPEYQHNGFGRYQYVSVIPSKDADEQSKRIFVEMGEGVSPSMRPSLYEPFENQWSSIVNKAKPFDELAEFNNQSDIDKVLMKYPQATAWLPLKAYEQSMVVLIDDKEIIKIVDLRPW